MEISDSDIVLGRSTAKLREAKLMSQTTGRKNKEKVP